MFSVVTVAHASPTASVSADFPAGKVTERPEWQRFFDAEGATGTVVVWDARTSQYSVYNRARANRPMSPASTFKYFSSLMALDAGVINDERELIPYDGAPRALPQWQRAMDLREAFRVSCLPCFQVLTNRIGRERQQAWLDAAQYGNHKIGTNPNAYWVDDSLQISAHEAADFVARLANKQLPFSARSLDAVAQMAIVEQNLDYKLHGKTGWFAAQGKPGIGWWVGWIERDGNVTAVALNIDMAKMADAPKRYRIVRSVLRDLALIND